MKHIYLFQIHGLTKLDSYTLVVTSNRKSKITAVPSVREFEKHYMCLLKEITT